MQFNIEKAIRLLLGCPRCYHLKVMKDGEWHAECVRDFSRSDAADKMRQKYEADEVVDSMTGKTI
jgi:hypothetical protein